MSSDDLDYSSSGFSSDGEDVRKDAELERRNIYKDLAIGGLEIYNEKEEDDLNVVQQEQELKTNEQLKLRYGSAREMQEHQKQNITQGIQRIAQWAKQNIQEMIEKPSDNSMNQQLSQKQSQLDRKMRQLQNRKNNELQKENKELQRKNNELQRQIQMNQLRQQQEQLMANMEMNKQQQLDNLNDLPEVNDNQSTTTSGQQGIIQQQGQQRDHFQTTFQSDQPFQQQTDFFQNITVRRETEQQNIGIQFQVSYETNKQGFSQTDLIPCRLAVWENSIYMFLLNAQKFDKNKALLWGKVLVLTQQELEQQKNNQQIMQYKHLQNACVVVDGLQYQYYLQLSEETHTRLFNLPDDISEPGHQTKWNDLLSQFGQPVLKDDQLIYEENKGIPDQFIKNKDELQKYIQELQTFIRQKISSDGKNIAVKPVLRVYCFNNINTPRHPRFWIRVRYDSALSKLPEFTKTNQLFEQSGAHNVNEIEAEYNRRGIVQMFGGSIDPLELFVCENQIKCCSWIRFKGVQVTMYRDRWKLIENDLQANPQNNLNYYNYEHYNKLLQNQKTRVFHEFYVPYDKKEFESLEQNDKLMPPTFSTLTFTFIWAQSEKSQQQIPFLSVLTYMPKVGIQSQGDQKDKDTITYIIGTRFDDQLPFQTKNMNVYLNTVSFGQIYQTDQARVHLISAKNEIDLIDKTHHIIAQHNPDFIIGHGIYDAYTFMFQQVFNKGAKLPEHIIKDILFRCSKLNQTTSLRLSNNVTTREMENKVQQIFAGRLVIDLERSIQEFSPDTKLTTIEHCFNTLFPDWSFQALPVSTIVECYKNLNNDFENVVLKGLLQQQFANLRVQRGLNVLQLYSGISRITYSPLQSVISHGRAKRVETLLLSRFVQLPFILPDYPNALEENSEKYEGGYVIEPQPGFYDSMIIVLDFNSLYPSVIREYEICFTTVPPDVKESEALQIIEELKQFVFSRQLPQLMGSLVQKRLKVKKRIKEVQVQLRTRPNEVQLNNKLQELDIEQLALKLCANSMYGCLGYRLGRFFCPKVASTITFQGRQALNNAINVAKSNGYKVVYGDTDSIMIDSKILLAQIDQQKFTTSGPEQNEAKKKIKEIFNKCESIASELTKKIGEGKQYLEMGMDYVFARQLLLQKKKYGALKIDPITYNLKLEIRGLDIVRRDWCLLSRQICNKVVSDLLWMGKAIGVEKTLDYLIGFKNDMDQRNDKILLEFFMLTKSITKLLVQYDKNQNMPHVEVARWLEKKQGKTIKPGFVVKYIALSEEGQQILLSRSRSENIQINTKSNGPFFYPYDVVAAATRGIHPLQLVDLHWYIKSQVIPPLERLYAPINDVSSQDVAGIFGFEYAAPASTGTSEHKDIFDTDLRRRYSDCFCFIYKCPKCNTYYSWPESPIVQIGFAPTVSFTKPSRRFRKQWADIEGKSFLDPQDFEKVQCGHQIDVQDVIEQLLQQIQHYEYIYNTGMRTCLRNDCVCHLSNEEIKKLVSRLPYAVESLDGVTKQISGSSNQQERQDNGQVQADNMSNMSEIKVEGPIFVRPMKQGLMCPGNICVEQQCGGELQSLFQRQNLVLQFLFFQEIFDRKSQFYREVSGKGNHHTSELFDTVSSVLSQYAKISGLGTVKVSDSLKKIFKVKQ